MSKATHNGTCQACGRKQAFTANGIAKHGYTTKWGYFSGTCSGSDRQPLELETSHNIDTVEAIRDWADQQDQMSHGNIETITVRRRIPNDPYFQREDVSMTRDEYVEIMLAKRDQDRHDVLRPIYEREFEQKIENVRDSMRRNAAYARKDADLLDALREKTFGNELEARFIEGAPKSHRETFTASKDEQGRVTRANAKAYDRQRELKEQGIRSRVTGDPRHATITYKR